MFFSPSFTNAFFLLSGAALAIYAFRRSHWQRSRKLPPGPKGLPIVGNLFQLSMAPWKQFEEWKTYGPVVYLNIAGQGLLSINTYETAKTLLDQARYTDRPQFIVAGDLLTGGLCCGLINSTKVYWRMRRAGQAALSKTRVNEYHPIQTREAVILTAELLNDSSIWEMQLARASASTIVSVLYDVPSLESIKDPLVEGINDFANRVAKSTLPGAHLVEFFPWMRYIPSSLAKWKRDAEEGFVKYNKMFLELFQQVKTRTVEGDERPCFSRTLLLEREQYQLNDVEAAWLCATLYVAGFETTTTTMKWFMLAMVVYPEKQRKCQEELDVVVGRSRMPTFQDKDSLPYICATVCELLRWRAAGPMGVPHVAKEDNWYQGCFIPKGTICCANVWSINRDKTVYGEDADDFNPDRFYNSSTDYLDGHATYGFGPRICLGRHMANNSLFINIASILWAAKISPIRDQTGKPHIPDTWQTLAGQLILEPIPFECSVTPRFPEAVDIISRTRELQL